MRFSVRLPLADNYFWRVYITGAYTRDCCPEYLKPDNFQRLKAGLVDRISVHTDSVQGFLENHDVAISRFVLLDHMDWLAGRFFPLLEAEWQAILDSATGDARVLWRSAGLRTDFLHNVRVRSGSQEYQLPELLQLHEGLARRLHQRDRVHTYGSFYIADLPEKNVVRNRRPGNVGNPGTPFLQRDRRKLMLEVGQVVRGQEHVVHAKPERPERAGRPTMPHRAFARILPRDVKVHDSDVPPGASMAAALVTAAYHSGIMVSE